MITYATGNLLEADVDALVNTVNTVGVMGKGIALQFKRAFPENYAAYRTACERGQVIMGRMHTHEVGQISGPRFIVNFPTKRHWKNPSNIDDIRLGLADLRNVITELGIKSIAVPPLGCGNGGLDWNDVRPLITAAIGNLSSVDVHLYAPDGAPEPGEMPVRTKPPELTGYRAAFVATLDHYMDRSIRRGLAFDRKVSLLEAHKVVYLLQKCGFGMRIAFEKAQYGPYAARLDNAISAMEGHYVHGYGDGTIGARAVLTLDSAAVTESQRAVGSIATYRDALARFDRLTLGFEDAYGLELLSTVLFAVEELVHQPPEYDAVVSCVQEWSARKRNLFKGDQIATAWQRLRELELV